MWQAPSLEMDILLGVNILAIKALDSAGSGMLNLRALFDDEDKDSIVNNSSKSIGFDGELFENIIMILIILFLLDSRI